MPDLSQNFSAQSSAHLHVAAVGFTDHLFGITSDRNIQHREVTSRVFDIEAFAKLADKIVVVPCDYAGQGELLRQFTDQSDCDFSARVGDAEVNLQFFNPAFQVRPLPASVDGVSQLHHADAGKGRPAARVSERAA